MKPVDKPYFNSGVTALVIKSAKLDQLDSVCVFCFILFY